LTQAELARRAKTSQAMVARYETGAASPTVRTLARLLHAAGRELVLAGPARTDRPIMHGPMAALLREHRKEILAAAAAVGASNVRIFCSVARGDETPDSDVDLLVDYPAKERGLFRCSSSPARSKPSSAGRWMSRRWRSWHRRFASAPRLRRFLCEPHCETAAGRHQRGRRRGSSSSAGAAASRAEEAEDAA